MLCYSLQPRGHVDTIGIIIEKALALAVIGIIGTIIGIIAVLLWFVDISEIGFQGTATFDQWRLSWVVMFCIWLFLW